MHRKPPKSVNNVSLYKISLQCRHIFSSLIGRLSHGRLRGRLASRLAVRPIRLGQWLQDNMAAWSLRQRRILPLWLGYKGLLLPPREEYLEVSYTYGDEGAALQDLLPVLLYGCETWTVTGTLEKRLDAFDTWCLRKILRIPYTRHTTNETVRSITGCLPVSDRPFA